MPLFRDREDAGRVLAARLAEIADRNSLVLALPRGGVPVGFEVAKAFTADLDVFLVRKLGVPGQEELAFGALASGGVRVLNRALIRELKISEETVKQITEEAGEELNRREWLYRDGRTGLSASGRTVILVDDGLATGASILAACRALRPQRVNKLIISVPVAAEESVRELSSEVDRVVTVATPDPFGAVGAWYQDFRQTTDEEVNALLNAAQAWSHGKIARLA